MKTIIITILAMVCAYIVLAPWLSIIDISKSIDRLTDCLGKLISEVRDIDREIRLINERIKKNDRQQSEPQWGLPVSAERPLADDEIVPRLRDINAQLGGSYAIDRAIEIIEAVATSNNSKKG